MRIETGYRYLLDPCMKEEHKRCPEHKMKDIYKNDRTLGLMPTGKTEKVFCECECHSE